MVTICAQSQPYLWICKYVMDITPGSWTCEHGAKLIQFNLCMNAGLGISYKEAFTVCNVLGLQWHLAWFTERLWEMLERYAIYCGGCSHNTTFFQVRLNNPSSVTDQIPTQQGSRQLALCISTCVTSILTWFTRFTPYVGQ